jgi:2-polyprenyl-6-methoxyphenol hydroxylase-like FAD-dependent oxidoreductase
MSQLTQNAVARGAGMAGLLAARVLSEFYETVTVIERDTLPHDPSRRGYLRDAICTAV